MSMKANHFNNTTNSIQNIYFYLFQNRSTPLNSIDTENLLNFDPFKKTYRIPLNASFLQKANYISLQSIVEINKSPKVNYSSFNSEPIIWSEDNSHFAQFPLNDLPLSVKIKFDSDEYSLTFFQEDSSSNDQNSFSTPTKTEIFTDDDHSEGEISNGIYSSEDIENLQEEETLFPLQNSSEKTYYESVSGDGSKYVKFGQNTIIFHNLHNKGVQAFITSKESKEICPFSVNYDSNDAYISYFANKDEDHDILIKDMGGEEIYRNCLKYKAGTEKITPINGLYEIKGPIIKFRDKIRDIDIEDDNSEIEYALLKGNAIKFLSLKRDFPNKSISFMLENGNSYSLNINLYKGEDEPVIVSDVEISSTDDSFEKWFKFLNQNKDELTKFMNEIVEGDLSDLENSECTKQKDDSEKESCSSTEHASTTELKESGSSTEHAATPEIMGYYPTIVRNTDTNSYISNQTMHVVDSNTYNTKIPISNGITYNSNVPMQQGVSYNNILPISSGHAYNPISVGQQGNMRNTQDGFYPKTIPYYHKAEYSNSNIESHPQNATPATLIFLNEAEQNSFCSII